MKLLNADAFRLFTYVSNVAADTTRLTCYFIPIPPFLYCLDPKSVLTVCLVSCCMAATV